MGHYVFFISIRRLTQYNLGSPTGLPARRAAAPERATRRALARVDGAQGLRWVVTRFREAGGWSWGANRDRPDS